MFYKSTKLTKVRNTERINDHFFFFRILVLFVSFRIFVILVDRINGCLRRRKINGGFQSLIDLQKNLIIPLFERQ